MAEREFGTYQMKPGHGIHTFRKRGIVRDLRPGDTIDCFPEELGGAMYKFRCIRPPGPKEEPKVGLKVVPIGGGWFNVVNEATGKPVNDKALRRTDAEQLASRQAEAEEEARVCEGCGASVVEGDPRCEDAVICKDCADELEEARTTEPGEE